MIDEIAREMALKRYGIPPCLHVPVAAVDERAITRYVGEIVSTLSGAGTRRAFLVRRSDPPAAELDYPIWENPQSGILHQELQVWVHVGFTRYRSAYQRAFPLVDLSGSVISHTRNRRMAALMGFDFVRLTATSRSANSSSAFSEGWGVSLHGDPAQKEANRQRGFSIAYADLTELMLMLDMKLGGGVMDAVNEAQKLIRRRPNPF